MNIKLIKSKTYIYRTIRGLQNKLRYGKNGPEFGELIYVNPQNFNNFIPVAHRSLSGLIKNGDWDLQPRKNLETTIIYQACQNHWQYNKKWQETGIYEYMLDKIDKFGGHVDGCSNLQDVIIRYNKLDLLFQEIKKAGVFKTQKEIDPKAFNENGGLLFHIDRNNELIFGGGGMHRFSMAKILKLKSVPAQVGLIHPDAIKVWKKYKNPPSENP